MDVALKTGIGPGTMHDERLGVARRIAEMCIEKHGNPVAAICVYGSTAVDLDLPYSDLDMTILTRADLVHLPTAIGKVRNGVIAKDRSHFLWALHDFGTDVCKALYLLNRNRSTPVSVTCMASPRGHAWPDSAPRRGPSCAARCRLHRAHPPPAPGVVR